MSVPFLAVTVFLAAILPGPERLVTPPSFGAGYREQVPRDLASDGTGFLALWIEPANGRDGLYAVAIRERGSGRPLPPRRIARGDIDQAYVVWAGDAYLAVWSDTTTRQLFAARLSRDAEPIGEPAVIGEGLYAVGLAWNGRSALAVVIADDWRKLVLSLAGDGAVERTTTLPIAWGVGSSITVAAAGDTFVVTWIETIASATAPPVSALRAMRFDGRGVSPDAVPAALPLVGDLRNGVRSISAHSDGERVGLAFVARPEDGAAPPWWETLRTFTIDPRTMAITETASRAVVSDVDVVATPRGFLAATQRWQDGQTVLVLTPFDGSPATEMMIPGATQFMLARSAGAVMAVWADFRLGQHLFGVALNESATTAMGQAGPVALPAIAQVNPIIAPAGDQALVLWIDLIGPGYGDVMAMRVDGDGNALDAPFAVGRGLDGGGYRTPAAVFTGQVWLVAWTAPGQWGRKFICRVSTDGRVLDPEDFHETPYAMASNGSVSVLASGGIDGISITRFSPAGALLDTMDVGAPARAGSDAQLATNGREFLLVWTEPSSRLFPSPDSRDVMAVRLDAGGMVLGSPIAVANGALDEGEPVVAGSDGGDFLVLYSVDKSTVRAKRVSREGVAGDEMLVANDPLPLALTRARSGYVAAFANGYESGTALISTIHLDRSGAPMGAPALISRSEAPWREMSLGVLNGSPVAVYPRSVAGPPFEDVPRLFMRTLKEPTRRRSVR